MFIGRESVFFQTDPLPPLHNPTQTPLPDSLYLPIDLSQKSSLGLLIMTVSNMTSQLMSTTMVVTSNVYSSPMFATSLKTHLYGVPSILPGH